MWVLEIHVRDTPVSDPHTFQVLGSLLSFMHFRSLIGRHDLCLKLNIYFRMMSDELSNWKTALYTRFRQAQSALQKLMDERAQLLQYLVHTKR